MLLILVVEKFRFVVELAETIYLLIVELLLLVHIVHLLGVNTVVGLARI